MSLFPDKKTFKPDYILFDFSQIIHKTYAVVADSDYLDTFDIFKILIGQLVSLNKKFNIDYNNIILCMDKGPYWRKEIFPFYKAKRNLAENAEAKSELERKFEIFGKLTGEVKRIGFKTLQVDTCEGDDLMMIASTFIKKRLDKRSIIVSGDKDLAQITDWDYIRIYNTDEQDFVTSKEIKGIKSDLTKHEGVQQFRNLLIAFGDEIDGIPNCKSPNSTFMLPASERKKNGAKQFGGKEMLKLAFDEDKMNFDKFKEFVESQEYFERNKKLIELSFNTVPRDLLKKVIIELDRLLQIENSIDIFKLTQYVL